MSRKHGGLSGVVQVGAPGWRLGWLVAGRCRGLLMTPRVVVLLLKLVGGEKMDTGYSLETSFGSGSLVGRAWDRVFRPLSRGRPGRL